MSYTTTADVDFVRRALLARASALAAGFADGIFYAPNACARADALYAQMAYGEYPSDGPYLFADGRMVGILRDATGETRAVFEPR